MVANDPTINCAIAKEAPGGVQVNGRWSRVQEQLLKYAWYRPLNIVQDGQDML